MKKLPSIKAILLAVIALSCFKFTTTKITEITVLQPTATITTIGNTLFESVAIKKGLLDSNKKLFDDSELLSLKQEIEVVTLATASPVAVYDGLTLEELAAKLDRSLSSDLSGYGMVYASNAIKYGVDPYLAVAISLLETGCSWTCSQLVKNCHNVGGMKGSGCGAYGSFDTLESGIEAMISNLSRNYISMGLTTPEAIGPKYAESSTWTEKVNNYIRKIKAN